MSGHKTKRHGNKYICVIYIRCYNGDWKIMESNVHTPWFQCSMSINKTFFFCLSISVTNTTSYNGYISVKMECSDELKCAATGRPGKLSLIERRCSVNRSASRLFVSPI